MFGSTIEDNLEFRINWQKPHTINREYQKYVHPDLVYLGDTFFTGPCTDVNADGVLNCNTVRTPAYHSVQEKLAVKRPFTITQIST